VIFFGAEPEASGLIAPSYQSFGADIGGLVASGEGTAGAAKEEALMKEGPDPKKLSRPT